MPLPPSLRLSIATWVVLYSTAWPGMAVAADLPAYRHDTPSPPAPLPGHHVLMVGEGSVAADWPAYRHDIGRSGCTPAAIGHPLSLQWTYVPRQAPCPAWPDPVREANLMRFDKAFQVVAAGGMAYFGSSADHQVHASTWPRARSDGSSSPTRRCGSPRRRTRASCTWLRTTAAFTACRPPTAGFAGGSAGALPTSD